MLKRIIGGIEDPIDEDPGDDPDDPAPGDPTEPAPPPEEDEGVVQIYPDNPYANAIVGDKVKKTTFSDGRVLLETPGATVWLHA